MHIYKQSITLLQSPAIHVGHGRMLQASLLEGLFFSLHPGLSWPFGSLQLTLRSLTPSPQETEHYGEQRKATFQCNAPQTACFNKLYVC